MLSKFSSADIVGGCTNCIGGFFLFLMSACIVIPTVAFVTGSILTFVSCGLFIAGERAREVSRPNFTPTFEILGRCVLAASLLLLLRGGAFAGLF